MLLQFAVENFLSIKEQVVLSMLVPAGVTLDPRYARRVGWKWDVLRCAAIYGANAAGKSNVIKALDVFRTLVTKGSAPDQRIGVTGFRLDPAWREKPTRFEVEVVLGDVRYSYGIELTQDTIVSEWLYRGEGDDERMLFERERGEDGATEHRFKFGEVAGDEEQRQFVRFVAKGTPANQPFLVESRQRNVTDYGPLSDWLERGVAVIEPHSKHLGLLSELEDSASRGFLEQRLRAWGTGVDGVVIHRDSVDSLSGKSGVERRLIKSLVDMGVVQIGTLVDDPAVASMDGDAVSRKSLRFRHPGAGGVELFDWNDESDGTRRLMHLLPVLRQIHQHPDGGQLLAVDELERSLHTSLTRRFVEEFLDLCASAPDTTAQMIFTTHDTNLLNGRLLPPASIWFVEKDRAGASHLYSLAEYPSEQVDALTEHLEDGYLQGRFGAIPFIASRDQLSWNPLKTGT
ncbi:MAG: ATP-binding protein [Deltaproteobacteria bacterium]|nr:ATP-binding protein [Myxococcales bacterium]MDP3215621.1 ATP-binding protein [Deltaproteobacteria bacterium]